MISPRARVDKSAFVDPQAEILEDCLVGANTRIYGKVDLAEGVWIEPNVMVYGPAKIGNKTYIGPNTVVGFPSWEELRKMMEDRNLDTKLAGGKPVKIGEGVCIRSNCTIYSDVAIGDNVRFGHNVMVRENVRIGNNTLIGTNVIIDGSCEIGNCVSMQTGVYVSAYSSIEDHVFLGPNCVLLNDLYMSRKDYPLKGPVLKKGSSIGGNATIFPAITVGEGAVVGAGAVVTRDVPPRIVVVGIPARKLKDVPSNWHTP